MTNLFIRNENNIYFLLVFSIPFLSLPLDSLCPRDIKSLNRGENPKGKKEIWESREMS